MNDPAPDVTILVPDLRAPTVGTAIRMRDMLAPARAEIVGPDFGDGVCAMYQEQGPFVVVPSKKMYRWPDFLWESRRIDEYVQGGWVIAFKAYMNTVPVALRLQKSGKARAAVFLDEWDAGNLASLTIIEKFWLFAREARYPLNQVYHLLVERMIPEASLVLSATTDLQKRFGGHVIFMGVDTERFRPRPPEVTASLRTELGLTGLKIVVFAGVVRPHKGIELILDALVQLKRSDAVLLIVGPMTPYLRALMERPAFAPYLRVVCGGPGDQGKGAALVTARLPDYLDLADCIALPMADTALSRSQMPIKVFEAMAMAKPVIASAVGDLPSVLGEHGRIVPPGDARALAAALKEIFDNPEAARWRGLQLRRRCIEKYSKEVCGSALRRLLGLA